MTPRQRPIDFAITLWLAKRGHSLASLARELDVRPQDINNWKKRGMPADRHADVARVLGVQIEQLLGLSQVSTDLSGGSLNEPASSYSVSRQHRTSVGRLKVSELLRANVGGELVSEPADGDSPLGFVEVHQVHEGLRAYRVRGDGLSPSVVDGEILVIDTEANPEAGERVLLELSTGQRMCRRLLFVRTDVLVVADINTNAPTTVAKSSIRAMHCVSAVYSARRWRVA